MPRIPRKYLDTTFFHIMSQGINRINIFDDPADIKYYIKNMYDLKNKYMIKIIAYCIMNNHTHVLVQCEGVNQLSKYMHALNTKYGLYYNKKYNRVGYVFRDRYKAEGIYGEEQLYNCIQYIYNNPVKAGICERPEQYKFSNYKRINGNDNDQFVFLDIEEKSRLCNDLIKDFLQRNRIKQEDLKKIENEDKVKELLKVLKDNYNISFRTISEYLKINRETLRRKYNKKV